MRYYLHRRFLGHTSERRRAGRKGGVAKLLPRECFSPSFVGGLKKKVVPLWQKLVTIKNLQKKEEHEKNRFSALWSNVCT
jgi:hypothetical protein